MHSKLKKLFILFKFKNNLTNNTIKFGTNFISKLLLNKNAYSQY